MADPSASKLIKFNNSVFSIPSPYQLAFFIKNLGINYNKEYLNDINNLSLYSTNFKKSINLGIYGADLGYINIYEQIPDATGYFSVLKTLSQDLGIANIFDSKTLSRIEKNMANKDSMLYILSNTYRKADGYLKDNDRNSIAVLIIAGGWVESLHILCTVAQKNPDKQILDKIAEQKHPLNNLIEILSPYYKVSNENMLLTDQLIELAYEYDGIDYLYKYADPVTDAEKKITYINSESQLIINEHQLKSISEKIELLRNSLIK